MPPKPVLNLKRWTFLGLPLTFLGSYLPSASSLREPLWWVPGVHPLLWIGFGHFYVLPSRTSYKRTALLQCLGLHIALAAATQRLTVPLSQDPATCFRRACFSLLHDVETNSRFKELTALAISARQLELPQTILYSSLSTHLAGVVVGPDATPARVSRALSIRPTESDLAKAVAIVRSEIESCPVQGGASGSETCRRIQNWVAEEKKDRISLSVRHSPRTEKQWTALLEKTQKKVLAAWKDDSHRAELAEYLAEMKDVLSEKQALQTVTGKEGGDPPGVKGSEVALRRIIKGIFKAD